MSFLSEIFRPLLDAIAAAQRGPVPSEQDFTWPPEKLVIRATTAEEAVARAEAWVGKPTRYRLGGGASVEYAHPFAVDGTCDCSGFTGHTTGHNRIQKLNDKRVSFYTDNVVRDVWEHRKAWSMTGGIVGAGPRRLYTKSDEVRPGDLIVRAGKYVLGRRVKIGHIAIITKVLPGFLRGEQRWERELELVHCTTNRGRENAVVRSDARRFRRGSYIVRPRWYQPS